MDYDDVGLSSSSSLICLRVGDHRLWLDARSENLPLFLSPCRQKFICPDSQPTPGDLILRVRNSSQPPDWERERSLWFSDAWELWQDTQGRYLIAGPNLPPPRWVRIEPDFTSGEVVGNFRQAESELSYPLYGLEIMLFVNWLAGEGDLILHSAGVEIDGRGYCLAGTSGAGKSTLTAALMQNPDVRVLGEDQVILRLRGDRFWIYGTPWHENPAVCSPAGVPLEKIFFLDRSAPEELRSLKPVEGAARLLQTAFIPYYRRPEMPLILERLDALSGQIPFFCLAYRLGSDILPTLLSA